MLLHDTVAPDAFFEIVRHFIVNPQVSLENSHIPCSPYAAHNYLAYYSIEIELAFSCQDFWLMKDDSHRDIRPSLLLRHFAPPTAMPKCLFTVRILHSHVSFTFVKIETSETLSGNSLP